MITLAHRIYILLRFIKPALSSTNIYPSFTSDLSCK